MTTKNNREQIIAPASDEGAMRQIRHKGVDGVEYHFETDDELVSFVVAACKSRDEEIEKLKAKAIDHEVKHDVAVSTLENVKKDRTDAQKALAAQCLETKELRQQLAEAKTEILTLTNNQAQDDAIIKDLSKSYAVMEQQLAAAQESLKKEIALSDSLKMAARMPGLGNYADWIKTIRNSHDQLAAAQEEIAILKEQK